jgi:hypothetical protein
MSNLIMPRHRSIERPPVGCTVRVRRNGVTHEGTYTVDGFMLTVGTLMLGTRSAHLGGYEPEALAKRLLAGLLEAAEEPTRR